MTKVKVLKVLKNIIDPELGINIIDLGLIYNISINQKDNTIKILMTLTTPSCPFNEYLLAQIQEELKKLKFKKINIQLTFDPIWTPARISKQIKDKYHLHGQ